MIDITKEEFWENKASNIIRNHNNKSKVKEFIIKHRIISVLLISLGLLMTINIILIYNFFKVLTTI